MTKEQKISGLILAYIASGMTIDAAFDKVVGEGAYKRLSESIWEKHNSI